MGIVLKAIKVLVIIAISPGFLNDVRTQDAVSIDVPPKNLAILSNQTATFFCRVTQPPSLNSLGIATFREHITLKSGRTISIDDRIVYTNFGGDLARQTRYNVSRLGPQTFQLQVEGVSLEDGGKYSCASRNDVTAVRSAELIVIDDTPYCQTNATDELDVGEAIKMSCDVTSQGRWAPVTHWSNKGDDVTGQNETIWEDPYGKARTVRYSVTKTIEADDSNSVHVGMTYFDALTDVGENEASNVPTYQHVYQFKPLVIKMSNTQRTTPDHTTMPTSIPSTATTSGAAGVTPSVTMTTLFLPVFIMLCVFKGHCQ